MTHISGTIDHVAARVTHHNIILERLSCMGKVSSVTASSIRLNTKLALKDQTTSTPEKDFLKLTEKLDVLLKLQQQRAIGEQC